MRNGIKRQCCALVIAHLPFRGQQNQRVARAIARTFMPSPPDNSYSDQKGPRKKFNRS